MTTLVPALEAAVAAAPIAELPHEQQSMDLFLALDIADVVKEARARPNELDVAATSKALVAMHPESASTAAEVESALAINGLD
jgi:hypothetical protein